MTPPRLYIIAGCNGAGKTTASFTVLPDALECREFVNADEIARGLSPFNPEEMAIEAGRLMLRRIQQLIAERRTLPSRQRSPQGHTATPCGAPMPPDTR